MASLCKEPRPLRKEWGPVKCAVYAARKEYELLVLLSTADAKVIAMARTMGQAAVHAPGEQRSEAAPTKQPQAPHRDSGESDRSREVPARRYTQVKRGKRERQQRQERGSIYKMSITCTLLHSEKGSHAHGP